MKQYFIGIDIGTSAAKTLLMDEHGVVTAQVSREYPLSFPHPGWSEQKPEDWWTQSIEGIKEQRCIFGSQGTDGALSGRAGAGYGNRLLRPDAWTGYAG